MGKKVELKDLSGFTREEVILLKDLAERYHTLPLSREELERLFKRNGSFKNNVEKVYKLLLKIKSEKILPFFKFNGRYLISLRLISINKNGKIYIKQV